MAGLTIKELFTTWGFKVDDKALDKLDDRLGKLKTSVVAVGATAVGAAVTIFGMAKSAAHAGDEAKKAAERLGIGVEALQEYQYAAEQAGVGSEGFQSSLKNLNRVIGDARNGSAGAKEQLRGMSKILGYDLAKSGKPAEDLLMDIADGFAGMSDPARKAALANDLFGRSGDRMINLLNGGSEALRRQREEARALGLVMDKEATERAAEFNDALGRAKGAVIGLKNTIGIGLLPMLTKLANRFTRYVIENRGLLKLRMEKFFDVLTNYVERAVYAFERMLMVVSKLVKLFGGWERVLKVVSTVMLGIMGMRFLAFLGTTIQVLGKAITAFQLLGKAGLLAQLQVAAVPILIGAAFIGLLLILEDIVAYFQGRKSITGLIVNNFDAVKGKVTEFGNWLMTKAKEIGALVGKAIVDGIAALGEADWQKVGETLLKVLELLFIGNKIVFQVGLAIADGILAGLIAGIREKFPKIAMMLGLSEEEPGLAKNATIQPKSPGLMDRVTASFLNMGQGESLLGIGAGAIKDAFSSSPTPSPAAAGGGTSVNAPITINVPAGTPPEQVGPYAQKGVKESLDGVIREAGRATKPAVAY